MTSPSRPVCTTALLAGDDVTARAWTRSIHRTVP
jgi:hypothetical protein